MSNRWAIIGAAFLVLAGHVPLAAVAQAGCGELRIDLATSRPPGAGGIFNATFTVNASASGACGTAHLEVRPADAPWENLQGPYPIDQSGRHALLFAATDGEGRRVERDLTFLLDIDPPLLQASIEPSIEPGAWHRVPPELAVSATDAGPSTIGGVRYRIGGGPWQQKVNRTNLTTPGQHVVEVEAWDTAGHRAVTAALLRLDTSAPALNVSLFGASGIAWGAENVTLQASAQDAHSGLGLIEWRAEAGPWQPWAGPVLVTQSGQHTVQVRATDVAGNVAIKAVAFKLDRSPPQPFDVAWLDVGLGEILADWSESPPFDADSGVSAIKLAVRDDAGNERREPTGAGTSGHLVHISSGRHWLRVEATDGVGNMQTTPWYAADGPLGTSGSAPARQAHASGTILLRPAFEGQALEVRFLIDGRLHAATGAGPHEVALDTRGLADGTHDVSFVVSTADGGQHVERLELQVANSYGTLLRHHAAWYGTAYAVLALAAVASLTAKRRWRAIAS